MHFARLVHAQCFSGSDSGVSACRFASDLFMQSCSFRVNRAIGPVEHGDGPRDPLRPVHRPWRLSGRLRASHPLVIAVVASSRCGEQPRQPQPLWLWCGGIVEHERPDRSVTVRWLQQRPAHLTRYCPPCATERARPTRDALPARQRSAPHLRVLSGTSTVGGTWRCDRLATAHALKPKPHEAEGSAHVCPPLLG